MAGKESPNLACHVAFLSLSLPRSRAHALKDHGCHGLIAQRCTPQHHRSPCAKAKSLGHPCAETRPLSSAVWEDWGPSGMPASFCVGGRSPHCRQQPHSWSLSSPKMSPVPVRGNEESHREPGVFLSSEGISLWLNRGRTTQDV